VVLLGSFVGYGFGRSSGSLDRPGPGLDVWARSLSTVLVCAHGSLAWNGSGRSSRLDPLVRSWLSTTTRSGVSVRVIGYGSLIRRGAGWPPWLDSISRSWSGSCGSIRLIGTGRSMQLAYPARCCSGRTARSCSAVLVVRNGSFCEYGTGSCGAARSLGSGRVTRDGSFWRYGSGGRRRLDLP
jgi:hypothetical protein